MNFSYILLLVNSLKYAEIIHYEYNVYVVNENTVYLIGPPTCIFLI
jgi:hypothetical protein